MKAPLTTQRQPPEEVAFQGRGEGGHHQRAFDAGGGPSAPEAAQRELAQAAGESPSARALQAHQARWDRSPGVQALSTLQQKLERRAQPLPSPPVGTAPIQGIWGYLNRAGGRKYQFRTERGFKTEATYTLNGKTYVKVGESDGYPIFGSVSSKEKAPQESFKAKRSFEQQTIRREKKKALLDRSRSRVTSFAELDPTRQEQVRALAHGIGLLIQQRFEDALAEQVIEARKSDVSNVGKALGPEPRQLGEWATSKRDQSKTFTYPVGQKDEETTDITRIHKLFGGSLDGTTTTKVVGGVEPESTLTPDGDVKVESQYAEYHRALGNRVGGGLDSRALGFLQKSKNKQEDELLLFAYLHNKKNMTFFEVKQSASDTPLATSGAQIFQGVPTPKGWTKTPDAFASPDFLDYLAKAVLGKVPSDDLGVPEEVNGEIQSMIRDLEDTRPRNDDSGGSVPSVIWEEVDTGKRDKISGVSNEKGYSKLKESFAKGRDVPGYIATVLERGAEHDDENVDWHRNLALALTPPSARKKALLGPSKNNPSTTTLARNIEDIAGKLGKYDYGVDVSEKQENVEALLKDDPEGALAINRYISGGFGSASDTLDAPWTKEGDQKALESIHAAVRGLERLPVHQGWAYRREEDTAHHAVGEIISPGVLWSAALAPKFGDQFAKSGEGTVYAIHGLQTGRDVQLLAGRTKWYQREVLFPPYARFVVESKQEDPRYGVVYTLKELPTDLGTTVPEQEESESSSMETSPSVPYQVEDEPGLRTLVDKAHWDKASSKLAKQEPWTQKEAGEIGIEGLGAGLRHPGELYGKKTAERWLRLIRWEPSKEEAAELWTVKGFLALAGEVSGKQQELRKGWSGWGSGDDAYYKLKPGEADSLVDHGLRVGGWFKTSSFAPKWGDKLQDLPPVKDYRDDDYNPTNKGAWVGELKKQARKRDVWLWRQDARRLAGAGVLTDESHEYVVKYGLSSSKDIRQALETALTAGKDELVDLSTQRKQSTISDEDYAKGVTRVAAGLQQTIVALHPFEDANGRISRLYMYKVLQAYLPTGGAYEALPVIPETGKDLTTSKGDWASNLWGLVKK